MPPDDWDFGAGEKKSSGDLGGKPAAPKPAPPATPAGPAQPAKPAPPAKAQAQGQIFEDSSAIRVVADSPRRRIVALVAGLLLAGGLLTAAIVGLSGGSDEETASATVDTGPGAIPEQTIPGKPDTEKPAVPNTITATRPADRPASPTSKLDSGDELQVRFIAEQWVNFAQSKNLGAFCIFMTDGFRAKLTGKSGIDSLSSCVQGQFPKFTLGKRLLPIKRVSGSGRSARVTYGNGQVAILRKQPNNTWKVDSFRR